MSQNAKEKQNTILPQSQGGRRLAKEPPERRKSSPQERRSRIDAAPPVRMTAEERAARRSSGGTRQRAGIPAWEENAARARSPERRPPSRVAEQHEGGGLYQAIDRKMRRIRRRWRQIRREERASRFPESNRLLIQMVLFFWGMVPLWASLLEEHTWGRRKRAISKGGREEEDGGRKFIHPVLFLAGACCIAAVALFFSTYTYGTTVTYDGKVMAVLPSEEEAEDVRHDIETVTAQTLGQTFTIDDDLIQYSTGLLKRTDLTEVDDYAKDLSQEVGLVTSAYCLYVDGERIGATPYEGALEELQKQIQASASDEDTISCGFSEAVEVKQEYVPSDEIVNLGYIAEVLSSTKSAEVTYEVKKGDTWSEIAQEHGITSKELEALNPGYDINRLQIGEVLTMSASVPYLTMTVVQRERYVDQVNYDIEYTDDPNMYVGDVRVTSKGQFGAADVVANVTYINGEETERTLLSTVTLKEPVTEQQLRGTKPRPTWLPTGSFRWPTNGRITSYFGYRKAPGGIYSTNHGGIDIATSRGNPVYAADGGTVTYSGWMGSYGYLVRINHGNGYETYYAHNSRLLVSVGAKVYKGQQIAKIGSTGNSTGPHCHFEVRYNGVRKNPLNYLP